MPASWTNLFYSALQSLAYKQHKYIPAGSWCDIIKEIEVIPIDTSETSTQPKPYAIAAGLLNLDEKVHIQGNFVLPTKVPAKKIQHYCVEYDENTNIHYIKEKKSAAPYPLYVLAPGLSPRQPTRPALKENNATDPEHQMTPQNKPPPQKQASNSSPENSSKNPISILDKENNASSRSPLEVPKSGPEQSLDCNRNTDSDSLKLMNPILKNEQLHSRNVSTATTVFSSVKNSSGATTPTSPITPTKLDYQTVSTDAHANPDELSVLIIGLSSTVPASFATPFGTMRTGFPGAWLETRGHHENTIDDHVSESASVESTTDTSTEFLEDIASSFLKKKITGPFCWIETGIQNNMTLWSYICGHFDPAFHIDTGSDSGNITSHMKNDTETISAENLELMETSTDIQDAELDPICEATKADAGNEPFSDPLSDFEKSPHDMESTEDEKKTSEGQSGPVLDGHIHSRETCPPVKITQDHRGEGHGLAHVFVGHPWIVRKSEDQGEESGETDSDHLTNDTMLQEEEKEDRPISDSSFVSDESTVLSAGLGNAFEGGCGLGHVFVGHPWVAQKNEAREEESGDTTSHPRTVDMIATSHQKVEQEDELTSNLPRVSTGSTIPIVDHKHLCEGGQGLQHVFVGHPWITVSEETKTEEMSDEENAHISTTTGLDQSNEDTETDQKFASNSICVSPNQTSDIPYCDLQRESTHDLSHVFVGHPWLSLDQEAPEEHEPEAGPSCIPTDNGSSILAQGTPNHKEIRHPLSHVFVGQKWLLPSDADKETSHGEVIDSPPNHGNEELSNSAEEYDTVLPVEWFALQDDWTRQVDDIESTTISPTEPAPVIINISDRIDTTARDPEDSTGLLIQSVQDKYTEEKIIQLPSEAINACRQFIIVKTQEPVTQQEHRVEQESEIEPEDFGTLHQICNVHRIQIELDEIDPFFYSIRQLFMKTRLMINTVEAEKSTPDIIFENPTGREIILRSLILENAADAKVSKFIRPGGINVAEYSKPEATAQNNTPANQLDITTELNMTAEQDGNSAVVSQATEVLNEQVPLGQEVPSSAGSNSGLGVFWLIFCTVVTVLLW